MTASHVTGSWFVSSLHSARAREPLKVAGGKKKSERGGGIKQGGPVLR